MHRHIFWQRLLITCAVIFPIADSLADDLLPQYGVSRMGTTCFWQGRIESLAFSPDGSMLASAGYGPEIIVWDVQTGTIKLTLAGHELGATEIAWAPDGTWLASGSWDKTVRVWELPSGQSHVVAEFNTSVRSIAISPDGKLIAAGNEAGTVRILDRRPGAEMPLSLPVDDRVCSIRFSPDGQLLAVGTMPGDLHVFDLSTNKRLRSVKAHKPGISSVAFSPDGTTIITTGYKGKIRLWNVQTGEQKLWLSGDTRSIGSATYSPDGATFATAGSDGTARIWDANTGRQLHVFDDHRPHADSVAFTPDGRTLAVGSNIIRLWDIETLQEIEYDRGHEYAVESVAFSDDASTLQSTSYDRTVRTWDVSSGRQLTQALLPPKNYEYLGRSADRKIVAVRGENDQVIIRDAEKMKTITIVGSYESLKESLCRIKGIAISPDGKTLALGGTSRTIWLWDVEAAKHITTLDIHPWAKGRARCANCNPGVHKVAFSADGRLLVSACDDTVVTELATGREVFRLSRKRGALTISPDSRYLVLSKAGAVIDVYDIKTGDSVTTLHGHRGGVHCLTFSKDGKLLASGSADTTIVVWDFATAVESIQINDTRIESPE